jgi:hypothetical protein
MIAEVIANYHALQDAVQSVAILRDETTDGSLHDHIKTASVSLLHNKTVMLTKELTPKEYNEEEEGFYVFFLHPPTQMQMYVLFTVELHDGRTAQVKNLVSIRDQLPYKGMGTNPMLPGKPIKDHTNHWDSENRERAPD